VGELNWLLFSRWSVFSGLHESWRQAAESFCGWWPLLRLFRSASSWPIASAYRFANFPPKRSTRKRKTCPRRRRDR